MDELAAKQRVLAMHKQLRAQQAEQWAADWAVYVAAQAQARQVPRKDRSILAVWSAIILTGMGCVLLLGAVADTHGWAGVAFAGLGVLVGMISGGMIGWAVAHK